MMVQRRNLLALALHLAVLTAVAVAGARAYRDGGAGAPLRPNHVGLGRRQAGSLFEGASQADQARWAADEGVRTALYAMLCVAGLDPAQLPADLPALSVGGFSCQAPGLPGHLTAMLRAAHDHQWSRREAWEAIYRGEDELASSGEYDNGVVDEPLVMLETGNPRLQDAKLWPTRTLPFTIFTPTNVDESLAVVAFAIGASEMTRLTNLIVLPVAADHPAHKLSVKYVDGVCRSPMGDKRKNKAMSVAELKASSQDVSISAACPPWSCMHELMHAAGFGHTQSRLNRDFYVKIEDGNIKDKKEHNFEKYKAADGFADKGTYDFDSIMHYEADSFSTDKGNKMTIVARTEADPKGWKLKNEPEPLGDPAKMGEADGFSEQDVEMINEAYPLDREYGQKRAKKEADDVSKCLVMSSGGGACALVNKCPFEVKVTYQFEYEKHARSGGLPGAGSGTKTVGAMDSLSLAPAKCTFLRAIFDVPGTAVADRKGDFRHGRPRPISPIRLQPIEVIGIGRVRRDDPEEPQAPQEPWMVDAPRHPEVVIQTNDRADDESNVWSDTEEAADKLAEVFRRLQADKDLLIRVMVAHHTKAKADADATVLYNHLRGHKRHNVGMDSMVSDDELVQRYMAMGTVAVFRLRQGTDAVPGFYTCEFPAGSAEQPHIVIAIFKM